MSDSICGYVTLTTLCTTALDYNEQERNNASHQHHNHHRVNKTDLDLDDMFLCYDDDAHAGVVAGASGLGVTGSSTGSATMTTSTTSNSGLNAFINAKNKAIHNMNVAISGITGEFGIMFAFVVVFEFGDFRSNF